MDTNELDFYIRKGRQLRAEFMADSMHKMVGAIKKAARCVFIECGPKKVMKLFRLPSARLVW